MRKKSKYIHAGYAVSHRSGLWYSPRGVYSLVEAFASAEGVHPSKRLMRSLASAHPASLAETLLTSSVADLRKLYTATRNQAKWGRGVYNYLQYSWLMLRMTHQASLVFRIGQQREHIAHNAQVRALLDHVKAMEKLAAQYRINMLWAFDWDMPTPDGEGNRRPKLNTLHVHVYCDNAELFEMARLDNALVPFVPTITYLSAGCDIFLPKINARGQLVWPTMVPANVKDVANASDYTVRNSVNYALTKILGRSATNNFNGSSYFHRSNNQEMTVEIMRGFHHGDYRHYGMVEFHGLRGVAKMRAGA